MKFCVVGINHHVTPIEIRERVHFQETEVISATDELLAQSVEEVVILSTCNRSEIYFLTENEGVDTIRVANFYEDFFNMRNLEGYIFVKSGDEALRHLFEVVIGLDSLVIGEDQILGQVRDAHLTSMELGASKKNMNKIFREAITFAKRVKADSDVSDHAVSISYIGVKRIHGEIDLAGKNCMLIGLGEMGKLALTYMLELGARIIVSNRTYDNSIRVQKEYPEVKILPFEELDLKIPEMDVLISATSSPHTIVKRENISMRDKPLYIMDLSLPRDVDPEVSKIAGVFLYDIDNLKAIADESLREKKRILNSYLTEIEDKIAELNDWQLSAKVDPIMETMNYRCNEIADDTLNYIFRKTEMTHNQKLKVDRIVRSALKKVLREPLLLIRHMEDNIKKETVIEALEELVLRDRDNDR